MSSMKAALLLIFAGFLASCTNETLSRYELNNVSYLGSNPASGELLSLRFDRGPVNVRYESRRYAISDYHYNAERLQGSILISNFAFADGTQADVVWLFTIAKNTQTLTLQIFDAQNKVRYAAVLLKQ